jgi:hypothetical protein
MSGGTEKRDSHALEPKLIKDRTRRPKQKPATAFANTTTAFKLF